jgi:DNA (cytosine-5)-methyltransferase 1
MSKLKGFTFIDIYPGVGGMSLPLIECGGHCLFSPAQNRFFRDAYVANFGASSQTKSAPPSDTQVDILAASPPTSLGMKTTRSILGFVRKWKPTACLIEAVKSPNISEWNAVLGELYKNLGEYGYRVTSEQFSIQDFGCPQRKKRLYMVALKGGKKFTFIKPPKIKTRVGDILEKNVPNRYFYNGVVKNLVYPKDEATATLQDLYFKNPSRIIVISDGCDIPRRLTPRETARLQGFPDTFKIVCSDTQSYLQFGSSACVTIIRAIAKPLVLLI